MPHFKFSENKLELGHHRRQSHLLKSLLPSYCKFHCGTALEEHNMTLLLRDRFRLTISSRRYLLFMTAHCDVLDLAIRGNVGSYR